MRNYKGKCESLHGHNWKVEVIVCSESIDEAGMVMDFAELKRLVNRVMEELDHKNLNEVVYFKTINPSSEEISRYLFDKLKSDIAARGNKLEEIRVWETDTSCAMYRE